MAFSFIKPDDLLTTFNDAKKYMTPLHEPLEEFERIARNRPAPNIAKDLPKVTDGTLAALIQEQPKRVIQQIPTGLIEAPDEWLEIVAGHILSQEIIPNANEVAALIQKCWAAMSKALTYGSQPGYVRFINRGDYFGTDFCLPYIKDVLLEPGKLSDRDSNVMLLRTWWAKNQIEAIIEKEKGLGKSAQDRGDEYESGWDLEKLADLITEKPGQKDVGSQTPAEKNKQLNGGFYEIVHVFQRGVGASFYSFAPRIGKDDNIVRTKTNKDPRGYIPIHFLYANIDMSNPLGRGAVDLSGGIQNLLDSEMQMYQYNRALMLNPPMKKWGNVSKATLKYLPNAIWDMGASKEAGDVEPAQIDSTAIANFPNNYGLLKSQILNLNSSTDTSVSADVGNPGFSKTPQGVKTQEQRLGVSDNYMRKQYESWFEEMMETGVNLWFAERSGVQVLTLDDDAAQKMRKLQPEAVNDQNEIQVDYDQETPKLKFQVDASSSNLKDNAEQLERATQILELTQQYPQLDTKQGGPIDVTELGDRIVAMIGLEDSEKIVVKPETDAQGNPMGQQQQQPSMTPEMVQQIVEQMMKANDANDPKNHPVARIMAALNIKGTDMDAETLRTLIAGMMQEMGIQPPAQTGPLPMEINANIQAHDAALKTVDMQHKMETAQQDQALKAAQFQHTQAQTYADNALKSAQFGHTVKSSDQSHELAVKSANKPVKEAK